MNSHPVNTTAPSARAREKGAALGIAIIVLLILATVSLSVLAVASSEASILGSDIKRTHAFYASSAATEKMTNDLSSLFRSRLNPTAAELNAIAANPPPELLAEGFVFNQTIAEDAARLADMRATQGIAAPTYPRLNIAQGPFAGLFASVRPFKMTSTATHNPTATQIKLERELNNYLVPLFQFGVFSNEDVEIHPGPLLTFNGRIHSNQNIYALRNTRFLSKVTAAGELVHDVWRNGRINTSSGNDNVWMNVSGIDARISKGSVQNSGGTSGGPNFPAATPGARGYFPGSPNGEPNPRWESDSILPADGTPNQFGGQLLTRTTGANFLQLPLQVDGNPAYELVKRRTPSDSTVLQDSRYHQKAAVRILIDDEAAGSGAANVAGIPAGQGVLLSAFNPSPLGGGDVLRRMSDLGTFLDPLVTQDDPALGTPTAQTVRGVRVYPVSDDPLANGAVPKTPNGAIIPPGSGVTGRILIEIIAPDGTARDVTATILSMGMTVGEPNAIVTLQRPLWAAYTQASRDRSGNNLDLVTLSNQTGSVADGEINDAGATFEALYGYLNTPSAAFDDDPHDPLAPFTPLQATRSRRPAGTYNQIVPLNIYNVREGWHHSSMNEFNVYERGMTGMVELNMRNLARWLDGVYDANLLNGTNAVSANISDADGYIVYFSDRRGDRVKQERDYAGATVNTTNGTVDNEDIYGSNGALDNGEDVITAGFDVALGANKAGTLQKDTNELPDIGTQWDNTNRSGRARNLMAWANPNNYFRRSLRLVNGERLVTNQAAGQLNATKGITVSAENIVFLAGNYNTSGVTSIPVSGSTLNDGGFTGAQIPASIVGDAFSPLSRTWFDALSVLYPEGTDGGVNGLTVGATNIYRLADVGLTDISQGTAVRAAILAGATVSALDAVPGRDAGGQKLCGGVINYPRFLEIWNWSDTRAWSYAGSFTPLFRSTQNMAQWENSTPVIYMPPRRNWSFDTTFRVPNRLPPGTPVFQYVEVTGFRQKITG
jgi:hypothetical protein